MTIAKGLTAITAACAYLSAMLGPARAQEAQVDQIEWLDIDAAAWEAELQTIFVPPYDGTESATKIGLTVERGISDAFSLGVELEFSREDSAGLALDEISLQAKLALIDQERHGIGLGLQQAVVIDRRTGNIGSETFFIVQTDAGGWDMAGNIVLASEPGDWKDWHTGYGLRMQRRISETLLLGAESGGTIDDFDGPAHWLGPVLEFQPCDENKCPALEIAAFAGLEHNTPDVQLRIEVNWSF